jgi:hypothetical protein
MLSESFTDSYTVIAGSIVEKTWTLKNVSGKTIPAATTKLKVISGGDGLQIEC